jgi:hypothetical protein
MEGEAGAGLLVVVVPSVVVPSRGLELVEGLSVGLEAMMPKERSSVVVAAAAAALSCKPNMSLISQVKTDIDKQLGFCRKVVC